MSYATLPNPKYHWLMFHGVRRMPWVTASRYTFDELIGRPWNSVPVFPLSAAQYDDWLAVRQLSCIGLPDAHMFEVK
jgi:hypothetical protein